MKTILIAHNYSISSFSYMSFEFANYLANKGYRVVFISHKPFFKKEKIYKKKKGELIVLSWSSKKRPTSLNDFIWFSKIFKKYNPDCTIGHFVGANIAISVSKILSFGKCKTFIYYHTLSNQVIKDLPYNKLIYYFKNIRKYFFYKFVDFYVCPSHLAKNDIIKTFNVNPIKTKVILNAIEDRFSNKHINMNLNNSKTISYLGRLDYSKNVRLLVNSFIKFKTKEPNSILKLRIAGSGADSKEIEKICKNHSYLSFIGAIPYDEVDEFLSKGEFTVIPSESDNLPTVGIESLMNCVPIIISSNTGLSKYCLNDINSFIIKPNQEELISIFEKISKKAYPNMRKEARKLFEEKFSIENYCIEMEKLVLNS